MITVPIPLSRVSFAIALTCASFTSLAAAEPEAAALSAGELAARLAAKQEGTAQVRARLATGGQTLQVLIKERRSRGSADVSYQVVFPRERKGEAVILRQAGGKASGTVLMPGAKPRSLSAAQMGEALFGTALSYQDVLENIYSWDNQAIVGEESVGRVVCQVLESKPGKGERSPYASVKSWVDTRRLVPLRVEKYGDGGRLVRRIETTRVVSQDGQPLPANLNITDVRSGVVTELEGSSIRRNVALTDRDFSPEGMIAGSAAEAEPKPR